VADHQHHARRHVGAVVHGGTLTANVVAGTSYFLVVDTYRAITSGSTTLTVSVP
jgi:hypothetical protein